MSLHPLFTMMLKSLLPLISLPLLRRFPWHVGKEEGSNIEQQEYEVGNAHQIHLDEIAINIWNTATNCQTHKTLKKKL